MLLLLVTTHATQGWDQAAVDRFRPDQSWGPLQDQLVRVMHVMQPRHSYAGLGLVTVAVAAWRRSWGPVRFAAVVAVASVVTTVAIKLLTRRPDWHGDLTVTGGSFPSGHMVALLVSLGCAALLTWSRTRWWLWVLLVVPGGALSVALSMTVAHWATDVLGGALVAVAILCWAASSRLRAAAYPSWGSAAADRRSGGAPQQQLPL